MNHWSTKYRSTEIQLHLSPLILLFHEPMWYLAVVCGVIKQLIRLDASPYKNNHKGLLTYMKLPHMI